MKGAGVLLSFLFMDETRICFAFLCHGAVTHYLHAPLPFLELLVSSLFNGGRVFGHELLQLSEFER